MCCCEYQKGFVLLVLKTALPPRTCTSRSLTCARGSIPTHPHLFSSLVLTELGAGGADPLRAWPRDSGLSPPGCKSVISKSRTSPPTLL